MTTVLLRTYNANRTLLHERGLTPGWAALKMAPLDYIIALIAQIQPNDLFLMNSSFK